MTLAKSLAELKITNSFAALPGRFYTKLAPQALNAPRLLHANAEGARLLGLDPAAMQSPEFLAVLSGAAPLPGGETVAAVYSGHQFGVWAGQLGDGRAHLLGAVQGPDGEWELQLKGSGMTPYSRMGDGRTVLRSSVREYLASEAMHGLNIPTTRALALAVSDDSVMRETVEKAAIVLRMSPSFVRFGSFEHWAALRDTDSLRVLSNYVIDKFYPECRALTEKESVLRLLHEVMRRTATLIAAWQSVGFCHGVMNTDNMSILGLTVDYGPYGFMDMFQLGHVCNHSDSEGRYAWNLQPSAGLWNLYRLGVALRPLVTDDQALQDVLKKYDVLFSQAFHARMALKLGISDWMQDDEALLDDLLRLMHTDRADFTLSFRRLADAMCGRREAFEELFMDRAAAGSWLDRLLVRHERDGVSPHVRALEMDKVNPIYVLRNHLAEQAIRLAKEGDASEIDVLLNLLRTPCVEQAGFESYSALPPDWAARISVSCSS